MCRYYWKITRDFVLFLFSFISSNAHGLLQVWAPLASFTSLLLVVPSASDPLVDHYFIVNYLHFRPSDRAFFLLYSGSLHCFLVSPGQKRKYDLGDSCCCVLWRTVLATHSDVLQWRRTNLPKSCLRFFRENANKSGENHDKITLYQRVGSGEYHCKRNSTRRSEVERPIHKKARLGEKDHVTEKPGAD